MNKRTVLELLKPKAKMLGFSRKELAKVADAILTSLPEDIDEADEESTIVKKIDEYLPLLKVGQSAASRQASTLYGTRSRAEVFDDEPEDEDDDSDIEPERNRGRRTRHANDDDDFADAPRWAKRLAKMFEQSSDSNVKRRAKVEALVEGMGNMGKHYLRDFDRHSFRNEEEWEDYFADLKEEIDEYIKERYNDGMSHMTKPVGAKPGNFFRRNPEEMTDEEVIALAKGE